MTWRLLIPVLALALGLAGCDKPAPPAAPPPTAPKMRAQLDPQGLEAVVIATGGSQLLSFSRTRVQTLVTMGLIEPTPGAESANSECGAGPLAFVAWPDGLTLAFQDDRFVGWAVDKPGLATKDGIGVGATRAQLKAARPKVRVTESTLGTEFDAGGLGGLLDGEGPDAKITHLWAGVTCMFR